MCTPKPKGDVSMANGKKYFFGWAGENCWKQGTEKAVCFTYAGGYTSLNDKTIWVPRSICITEPANEYGNFRIYIPCWFFKKAATITIESARLIAAKTESATWSPFNNAEAPRLRLSSQSWCFCYMCLLIRRPST